MRIGQNWGVPVGIKDKVNDATADKYDGLYQVIRTIFFSKFRQKELSQEETSVQKNAPYQRAHY